MSANNDAHTLNSRIVVLLTHGGIQIDSSGTVAALGQRIGLDGVLLLLSRNTNSGVLHQTVNDKAIQAILDLHQQCPWS